MQQNATAPAQKWSVPDFVQVLKEQRGIERTRFQLHRYINDGVPTKAGKRRYLKCSNNGRTRYLTLAQWDQFFR